MLKDIISYKTEELKLIKKKTHINEIRDRARDFKGGRDFKAAITPGKGLSDKRIRIIGEIKKASPSLGIIREDFDPIKIADIYEENGISAISVLTDKYFFKGDIEYLKLIKNRVHLPILRKDFIFDEYQIFESAAYNADAILLIAAILEKNRLIDYLSLCAELNMQVLLEVHDMKDVEKVYEADNLVSIVGINNRDLKTFKVDINTSKTLIEELPDGKTIVSESGIKNKDDIITLTKAGVDAFLIGETFMREADITKKVKEFVNV